MAKRYERKYRVEACMPEEVLHVIRMNPAGFRKAFPDRYINSIYLDTPSFTDFNENLAGVSERAKRRIRWYGNDLKHLHKPQLEIKRKENLLGWKDTIPLPDFSIGPDFSFRQFCRQHLSPLTFWELVPTALVRYKRAYFVSMNKQIRLTVDTELTYYATDDRLQFQSSPYHDPAIILELKYERQLDKNIDYITQAFPFRMTRNSKYVSAVLACRY